ncbi:E3 ubiquitin/ISG15 ligase TRIM25-like [Rhinophrynus dorsalis]
MASADLREELNCSICLSIYTDPVTLQCGHNFCQDCIVSVLDTQEGSGVYSCPECRAEYQQRPALQRNMKLCNIVERFLSTHPDQEETTIFCTYCDSQTPAVKTCLQCEASLCANHLKKHTKSSDHILMQPTASLESRKCPIHKKLLEYYCSLDGACICVSCCLAGEHRGHQVESLNEAFEKKKLKLINDVDRLISEREETERSVQSLLEHKREVQKKAVDVTERVTALITDIREQLEALEKRVLSEISRQEEQVSLHVSGLIQQLETKKDELSRKIHLIEEMSNMTDPLSVFQQSGIDFLKNETKEIPINISCNRNTLSAGDIDQAQISVILHRDLKCLTDKFPGLMTQRGFQINNASRTSVPPVFPVSAWNIGFTPPPNRSIWD